jgi:hypothetical protein
MFSQGQITAQCVCKHVAHVRIQVCVHPLARKPGQKAVIQKSENRALKEVALQASNSVWASLDNKWAAANSNSSYRFNMSRIIPQGSKPEEKDF